jgi:hypothetical protein
MNPWVIDGTPSANSGNRWTRPSEPAGGWDFVERRGAECLLAPRLGRATLFTSDSRQRFVMGDVDWKRHLSPISAYRG